MALIKKQMFFESNGWRNICRSGSVDLNAIAFKIKKPDKLQPGDEEVSFEKTASKLFFKMKSHPERSRRRLFMNLTVKVTPQVLFSMSGFSFSESFDSETSEPDLQLL